MARAPKQQDELEDWKGLTPAEKEARKDRFQTKLSDVLIVRYDQAAREEFIALLLED